MASVKVIPATERILSAQETNIHKKRRVAAYARVSTDSEEQLSSYEAQVDYYTKLIQSHSDWEFVAVYTDEGISAVNTKKREGFKQMLSDGLEGKFDFLVTKSVSRFARNTVDSLTTVRKLKEKGVEIWFEKENIYTLDSKGELLITIMSSLAQEESRSISENVTWGQRKRMADGKVSLPYKQFLGYRKGEDGFPEIIPEEAEIVRFIFRLFMEGKTFSAIAKELMKKGIPTPAGKKDWQACVVQSILSNEKYKGDALLQKTYCVNFLTKKMVKNTGQVQQYYVEESHPAIIDPEEWDAVQAEIRRRKQRGSVGRCGNPFAGKLVCGDCGGFYGRKIWGSYKENKTYRKEIYRCNEKYKKNKIKPCSTPAVTEEEVKENFLIAFNKLMENREGLLFDCRTLKAALCDTREIDIVLENLRQEIELISELSRKAIYENAKTAQNQDTFMKRNNSYMKRHTQARERLEALEEEKQERLAKSKILDRFMRDIRKRPLILAEWEESLWFAVIDQVRISMDGRMTFQFRNDSEITV